MLKLLGTSSSIRKPDEGETLNLIPKDEMGTIKAHLRFLRYNIKAVLGIIRSTGPSCTHIWATTSQGYDVMIRVDYIPCEDIIVMDRVVRNLCSKKMRSKFLESTKSCPTGICVVNNLGIDTCLNSDHNYLFASDLTLMKIVGYEGEKASYHQVLPHIDYSSLASEDENNTIRTFVSHSPDTGIFYNIIEKLDCKHLLGAPGNFHILVPSDEVLNEKGLLERYNEQPTGLQLLIYRHILIQDSNGGKPKNLLGTEIDVSSLPIVFAPLTKSNGRVSVIGKLITESPDEKEPDYSLFEYDPKVSDSDIATTSLFIFKTCNYLAKSLVLGVQDVGNRRKKFANEYLEEVNEMTDKGKAFAEKGNELLRLNNAYRELLYIAPYYDSSEGESPRIVASTEETVNRLQVAVKTIQEAVVPYQSQIIKGMMIIVQAIDDIYTIKH